MNREQFLKRLEDAERLVNSWPEWKRHVLVKTSSATVDVPRKPLVKADDLNDYELPPLEVVGTRQVRYVVEDATPPRMEVEDE